MKSFIPIQMPGSAEDYQRAQHVVIELPIRRDRLAIDEFYNNILSKQDSLENDLFMILKEKQSSYFYQTILLDELWVLIDQLYPEGPDSFKNHCAREFIELSDLLIKKAHQFHLYRKNQLMFHQLFWLDPYSVVFCKLYKKDIDS